MNKKVIALTVVLLVIIGGVVGAMFLRNNDSTNSTNNVSEDLSLRNENEGIINNNDNNEIQNNTDNKANENEEIINNNDNKEIQNNTDNKANENGEIINNDDNNGMQNNTDNNANDNTEIKNKKALVVYFSQSGNTEKVANFIKTATSGDIIELETVKEYPSDYNELLDYAQNEQKQNARPELKTKIDNIEEYDVIFLGYPNWWGDMPMPLYTFLDEYDLSEKTIAPFVTSGGSGLSGTPKKIKDIEKNATVTEGLSISGSQAGNSESSVNSWIQKIGL